MPALVGSGMNKYSIISLDRLSSAIQRVHGQDLLKEQMRRTQSRLKSGIDLDGKPFAPLKEKSKSGEVRQPIKSLASCLDSASYSEDNSLTGMRFSARLVGRLAQIAFFQNMTRRFWGYSDQDKQEVRRGLTERLREELGRWL